MMDVLVRSGEHGFHRGIGIDGDIIHILSKCCSAEYVLRSKDSGMKDCFRYSCHDCEKSELLGMYKPFEGSPVWGVKRVVSLYLNHASCLDWIDWYCGVKPDSVVVVL